MNLKPTLAVLQDWLKYGTFKENHMKFYKNTDSQGFTGWNAAKQSTHDTQDLRPSEGCGPLALEAKGKTILQNVRNHSPNDIATHITSLESSQSTYSQSLKKKIT